MNKIFQQKNDMLKIIAITAMIIDHIGFAFFPYNPIFRVIGRLAMPIFAFGISTGYQHTSNLKKYLERILIFALISQAPYSLFFQSDVLNILFLFLFSIAVLYLIDKKKYILIIPILLLFITFAIDYSFFGLLTVVFFYIFKDSRIKIIISQGLLISIFSFFSNPLSVFHFIGVLLVLYFPQNKLKLNTGKYFFYWFYPAHLLILFLIKKYFN